MSTIKSIFIQHLNGTTPNATMDTNGNFTVGGTVSGASSNMFRNRIINGAMTIDQRNAGASVTPTSTSYGLDRWKMSAISPAKYSFQQNAGSVTPPAGFTNYLGVTSSSSYNPGATETFLAFQYIEGYNVTDLDFGKSTAKTVTLSFWVRSSLTGTFGGVLGSGIAPLRSYPFTYTINSANTWEYKTITIPGDTTGTYNTSNSIGLSLYMSFGTGSTYSGAAGSWSTNEYYSATGATNVLGTNGATWYITGVQLEVGTAATPFENRSYGHELALCQRYCLVKTYPDNIGAGIWYTSSSIVVNIAFPVVMRAAPTLSGTFAITAYASGSSYNITNQATLNTAGTTGCEFYVNHSSAVSTGGHATSARLYSGTAILSAEL